MSTFDSWYATAVKQVNLTEEDKEYLNKLQFLHTQGILTDAEYENKKKELISKKQNTSQQVKTVFIDNPYKDVVLSVEDQMLLDKLEDLRATNVLTEEEFKKKKREIYSKYRQKANERQKITQEVRDFLRKGGMTYQTNNYNRMVQEHNRQANEFNQLAEEREKTREAIKERDKYRNQVELLTQQNDELRKRLTNLKEQLDTVVEYSKKLKEENLEKKAKLERELHNQELEDKVKQLEKELEEALRAKKEAEEKVEEYKDRENQLLEELQRLQLENEKLSENIVVEEPKIEKVKIKKSKQIGEEVDVPIL